MKVTIQSRNILTCSKGKPFRIAPREFSTETSDGKLVIVAEENEVQCSKGITGSGPVKEIERTLELELSSTDLKSIFDAAIAARLLRIDVTAQ